MDSPEEHSRMAGHMSHMARAMDSVGVPAVKPMHRRVELLCLMLEESRLREKQLKLAELIRKHDGGKNGTRLA